MEHDEHDEAMKRIQDGYFSSLIEQTKATRSALPHQLIEPTEMLMRGAFDFGWQSVFHLMDRATALDLVDRLAHRFPPPDGVACKHPGCLSHHTHPCEGCGRVAGMPPLKYLTWQGHSPSFAATPKEPNMFAISCECGASLAYGTVAACNEWALNHWRMDGART